MDELVKGDYVLATKYHDGHPGEHWVVGYFDRMAGLDGDRYIVVDSGGMPFRASGFRRAEKITKEVGAYLLDYQDAIEDRTTSLWSWATYGTPVKEKQKPSKVEVTKELLSNLRTKAETLISGKIIKDQLWYGDPDLWHVLEVETDEIVARCDCDDDSEYIAAANPIVILALIDKIEELEGIKYE